MTREPLSSLPVFKKISYVAFGLTISRVSSGQFGWLDRCQAPRSGMLLSTVVIGRSLDGDAMLGGGQADRRTALLFIHARAAAQVHLGFIDVEVP